MHLRRKSSPHSIESDAREVSGVVLDYPHVR